LRERISAGAKLEGQPEDVIRQRFIDRQPMGRVGTPAEIASIAAYLASDEATFATARRAQYAKAHCAAQ
jgi:2-keto-3-deoxy-L-fuconate dehydrogenase